MPKRSRAILERLAYASWLGMTGISVITLIVSMTMALSNTGIGMFIAGSSGMFLSRVINELGRRHLHFDQCERSLNFREMEPGLSTDPAHAERAETLRQVLEEWETMEEQPPSGGVDIWRRHALRREVQSLLAMDPALKREFQEELREHPEIS